MASTVSLEDKRRLLEEKRKQLEERRRILDIKRTIEDEELKTEEDVETTFIRKQFEERKRALAEKKRLLEEKHRKEEDDLMKEIELNMTSTIEPLTMSSTPDTRNANRANIEEKRKYIEQKRKQLEDRRRLEENELRLAELEEKRKENERGKQLALKRKLLEDRKKQLEVARLREDQELKMLQTSEDVSMMAMVQMESFSIEEKRREIEERRKALEEKKRALQDMADRAEQERRQALEEERLRVDLERKHKEEIELRKKQLEERRRALAEQRKIIETKKRQESLDSLPQLSGNDSMEIDTTPITDSLKLPSLEKMSSIELEQQRRHEQDTERMQVELKHKEDETAQRRAEIEGRKKVLEEQKRRLAEERNKSSTMEASSANLDRKKRDLEDKKAALQARRQKLTEDVQYDKLTAEKLKYANVDDIEEEQRLLEKMQLEQRKREEENEKKKLDIERRKKELADKKRKVDEQEPQSLNMMTPVISVGEFYGDDDYQQENKKSKVDTLTLPASDEREQKLIDLERKKKLLQERKQKLDEQKKQTEVAVQTRLTEVNQEQERLLEVQKKLAEERKHHEVKLKAEQEELARRRAELERRRKELQQRLKDEKKQDTIVEAKMEEEVLAKKGVDIEREEVNIKRQAEEIVKREQEELNTKRKALEDKRKQLNEKKRQLEFLKNKEQQEGTKNIVIAAEVERDEIAIKKSELDDRRRALQEKKATLEAMRAKEEMQAELESKAEQQLIKRREELENRKRDLVQRRKELEQQKLPPTETIALQEEKGLLSEQEEVNERRKEIEARRKAVQERKIALEKLRSTQEEELTHIDKDQLKLDDLEELFTIKAKKAQLEERKRQLEEKRKALEDKSIQQEKWVKSEEESLELRRKDLEERRKKLSERRDNLAAHKQYEEELETRRKELEERRKHLDEKKKLREQEKLIEKREEQAILDTQVEVDSRKKELEDRQVMLEAKVTPSRKPSLLLDSEKANQILAALNKEQQRLLGAEPEATLRPLLKRDTNNKSSIFNLFKKQPSKVDEEDSPLRRSSLRLSSNSQTPPLSRGVSSSFFLEDQIDSPGDTFTRAKGRVALQTSSMHVSGNSTDMSPLHHIVKHGNIEELKNTIDNLPPEHLIGKDSQQQTILHIAAFEGHLSIVEYLLNEKKMDPNHQDKGGWTALHCAAFQCSRLARIEHLKICQILLESQSTNGHLVSTDQNTPFHYFVRTTCAGKDSLFKETYSKIVNLMIERGIDYNLQNNKGETCLHQAALRGAIEAIEIMLARNLPASSNPRKISYPLAINIANKVGETALHNAVKAGNMDIISILLKCWADLTIVSEQGSVRDLAVSFNQEKIAHYIEEVIRREDAQTKLPSTVWLNIFKFMPPTTLVHIGIVCKQFRRIADNDTIWKKKCEETYLVRKGILHSWKQIWKHFHLTYKDFQLNQISYMPKQKLIIKGQSHVRGWLARNLYKKILKMRDKRDKLIQELVDTEGSYVKDLNYIIKLFLNPLRYQVKDQKAKKDIDPTYEPFITAEKVRMIFTDIELIFQTNNMLYEKLAARRKQWSNTQIIGDIFVTLGESLKVYTQYVNNYERSQAVLQECRASPQFAEWIKAREEKTKLESYLIRVIQRIPRQKLLLEGIAENTWRHHPDYYKLRQGLQKVEHIAKILNERKRDFQNQQMMMQIEQSLEGGQIITPQRRFVREDEFLEVQSKEKKLPVYIFLFNDVLLVCRPQKKRTIPPKYKFLRLHRLSTTVIKDRVGGDEPGDHLCFEVITPKSTTLLMASSAKLKEDFISATKRSIIAARRMKHIIENVWDDHQHDKLDSLGEIEISSDMPIEKKVKYLEMVLAKTKADLEEERNAREAADATKRSFEAQLHQTLILLNEESRLRTEAQNEAHRLQKILDGKEQYTSNYIETDDSTDESDDYDRFPALSDKEKAFLQSIGADASKGLVSATTHKSLSEKEKKKLAKIEKRQKEKIEKEHKKTMKLQQKEEKKQLEMKKKLQKGNGSFSATEIPHKSRLPTMFQVGVQPTTAIRADTAIHAAIKHNNKEVLKTLLETGGISINQRDSLGQTPLQLAAAMGNLEIIQLLFAEVVKFSSSSRKIELDLNSQDNSGWTALHSAAYHSAQSGRIDYLRICEYLLQQETIDIQLLTIELNSPLHFLIKTSCYGKGEDFRFVFETVLNMMLEKGADINQQNHKGESALHLAASIAHGTDSLRWVLDRPKQTNKQNSDVNLTTKAKETALHYAVKANNVMGVSLLLKYWADYSIISNEGFTPQFLAANLKNSRLAQLFEEVAKKEERNTPLPPPLWTRVFHFVKQNHPSKLQAIPLVCHEWRRVSGRLRMESLAAERATKNIELEKKFLSIKPKQAELPVAKAGALDTIENLRVAKQAMEEQLKQAALLLTEETKRRKQVEARFTEQTELPEKIKQLEEANRRLRVANDTLQQQFMLQVEKIGILEKQVKQFQNAKLEYETKYEERVYFMEKKAREVRDKMEAELQTQLRELRSAKKRLEEENRALRERARPEASTGPPIPQRPEFGSSTQGPPIPLRPNNEDENKKRSLSLRPIKKAPENALAANQPELKAKLSISNPIIVPSTGPPTSIIHLPEQERSRTGLLYDIWEEINGKKVVIAVDLPGMEVDQVDFRITGPALMITRKMGLFEERNLVPKYQPRLLHRLEKSSINQLVLSEILLPFVVHPDKKKAFQYHGTIYLSLEKPDAQPFTITTSDFVKSPIF